MSSLFPKKPALPMPPKELPKDPKWEDGRELEAVDHSPSIRLGIIIGHERKEPGANLVGGGNEYSYNKEVANLIDKISKESADVDAILIYRDGIGISGAYHQAEELKCDCVIELHFNAYNARVQGTSTLCSFDNNDVEFAHMVHKQICKIFDRDGMSRGVKTLSRNARGGGNVYGFPKGVNCLVEPFFGDNPEDAKMGAQRKAEYARAIVDAVTLWGVKKDLL